MVQGFAWLMMDTKGMAIQAIPFALIWAERPERSFMMPGPARLWIPSPYLGALWC